MLIKNEEDKATDDKNGESRYAAHDLLFEMEAQSKRHIDEINRIHEHYRYYVTRCEDIEERMKQYK